MTTTPIKPQGTNFWKNKKVFLTGHTGFKGSWLTLWLKAMGANVIGYSLPPQTTPNLFTLANVAHDITSIFGNICDIKNLSDAINKHQPEIILHLAAQALVRPSYDNPVETFATNIMGTVNVLEAARLQKSVRAIVVVTSDKCYDNKEWIWSYRENEPMGGYDPYSSSKGCAELVSSAYRNSFFTKNGIALATARAGNVIGGGDWSQDRLVPDILNAIETKSSLIIRNPLATRPWQHVLEPLYGYLLLAENLYNNGEKFASAWNFGPAAEDVRPVKSIIERLEFYCKTKLNIKQAEGSQPHEAHLLSLDSTKARIELKWKPQWNLEKSLAQIANWHENYLQKKNMRDISLQQISDYSQLTTLKSTN